MRRRALLAASAASGGGLITFFVNDVEYQAENGMTWEDWVNSEYNSGEFGIDIDDSIGYGFGGMFIEWVGTNGGYVYAPDIIQENYYYWLVG